jgi:UDP-galactopyranose mutase
LDYHEDAFSGVPANGFNSLFDAMSDGCRIQVGCSAYDWQDEKRDLTIYTGPLDEYFDHCLGSLPYRSLSWDYRMEQRRDVQIINECNERPFTRSCDHGWWTPQPASVTKTVIGYETPQAEGPEMYPMDWGESANMAAQYRNYASKQKDTVFCGRLAEYRYLDMDRAVASAWNAVQPYLKKKEN